MKPQVLLEWAVLMVPCLIGLGVFYRTLPASPDAIHMADLDRLADILSLWALVAVVCWCGTRLCGGALRATPSAYGVPGHDRTVARVLLVLVGFAGLLVCEPIGDGAEKLFLVAVGKSAPPSGAEGAWSYAGFAIQFLTASAALGVLVKLWARFSARLLKLGR